MTQTSQDNSVSHSRPQDCPLCNMWALMPYAKKWSTPTTVIETESALVVGFWLGVRYRNIKLCKRHGDLVFNLNRKEIPLLLPNAPQPQLQSIPSSKEFNLGLKPFTNENVAIQAAPSPLQPTTVNTQPTLQTTIINTQPTINTDPVKSVIDFAQLALEAAKMPPVEGKKITYCPICGKEVTMGEVHACQNEQ